MRRLTGSMKLVRGGNSLVNSSIHVSSSAIGPGLNVVFSKITKLQLYLRWHNENEFRLKNKLLIPDVFGGDLVLLWISLAEDTGVATFDPTSCKTHWIWRKNNQIQHWVGTLSEDADFRSRPDGTLSSWWVKEWPLSRQNSRAKLWRGNNRSLVTELRYWTTTSRISGIIRVHIIYYPKAEDNSSVVPSASNTWSSLGLRSPVKVLEKPSEKRTQSGLSSKEGDQLCCHRNGTACLCLRSWCRSWGLCCLHQWSKGWEMKSRIRGYKTHSLLRD